MCCKIMKAQPSKTVGQAQYKLANTVIADNTGQISLDLWNDYISQVQEHHVYKMTNLSLRFWNGIQNHQTIIHESSD